MPDAFDVIELNSNPYKYMVINKDTVSIRRKIKDIERVMIGKSFSGNVLFNCLTTCRDLKKSYSSIYFDGSRFNASTWKDVGKVGKDVSKYVKDYFTKNISLLQNPPLPYYL